MKKNLEILELIAGLRIPSNTYSHPIESKVGDLVLTDNRVASFQVSESSDRRPVGRVVTVILSYFFGNIFGDSWVFKRAAIRTIMFRL